MAESTLMVTQEEAAYLVELLEKTLKETRVEEHRTRAPGYREHVIQRENVIIGLLKKLGHPGE
jgi:hypothetical protein